MKWKGICLWVLIFYGTISVAAQSGNPFELTPRLSEQQLAALDAEESDTTADTVQADSLRNPFDIVAPLASERSVLPEPVVTPIVKDPLGQFKFIITLLILLILATLVTLMRTEVARTYEGFINDNLLNQLFRDQEGRGALPFYLLYSIFFLNAGLLLFYILQHYKVELPGSPFLQFAYCFAGVTILFLLKHLLLTVMGVVFPIQKEIKRYNFLIIVFGIILGLILVPVNLLLSYGPEGSFTYILFGAFGLIGLVYLFRSLRALLLANRFLAFHKFHFLLYI